MARPDPTERWKKKVAELQIKISQQQSIIASLRSEDSAQDQKIQSLNKLHQQKVRALMQSIQELKKQSATLRNQNKENNRSKLIEKLKVQLAQQEVVIQSLRDLVRNDQECDQQIIAYLNKGPPRIRPMSREELRIQIRKLKGMLASKSSKGRADLAVDDLDKMFNAEASMESERLVDPLQNEKIVELYSELENFKIDIRSKEHIIDSLRKQILKLQQDLQKVSLVEVQTESEALERNRLEGLNKELSEKLTSRANQEGKVVGQKTELQISVQASAQQIQELKQKISLMQDQNLKLASQKNRIQKELAQAMAMISDLQGQVNFSQKSNSTRFQNFQTLLTEKDIRIAELETELLQKQALMDSLNRTPVDRSLDQTLEGKQIEIEVLRAKVQQLTTKGTAPSELLQAQRQEAFTYKQKVKELSRQVVDLQEEIEFLQASNLENQKQGAALYLAGKRPASTVPSDYEQTKQLCENFKNEIRNLKVLVSAKDTQISDLKKQVEIHDNSLVQVRKQLQNSEEHKIELEQKFLYQAQEKQRGIELNNEIKRYLYEKVQGLIPRFQINIPNKNTAEALVRASNKVYRRLINP